MRLGRVLIKRTTIAERPLSGGSVRKTRLRFAGGLAGEFLVVGLPRSPL